MTRTVAELGGGSVAAPPADEGRAMAVRVDELAACEAVTRAPGGGSDGCIDRAAATGADRPSLSPTPSLCATPTPQRRGREQVPTIAWPQPRYVCALLLIGYFLVTSGVIYDWVTNTPSAGTASDPLTGERLPPSSRVWVWRWLLAGATSGV
jgi:hypothetical protein